MNFPRGEYTGGEFSGGDFSGGELSGGELSAIHIIDRQSAINLFRNF